jgi:small subunit ribosomal protein S29
LREALGIDNDEPYNPFTRRSPELVGYAEGLRNILVPNQMKVAEAASLFEVWAKDGALHTSMHLFCHTFQCGSLIVFAEPTDETFLSMYTSASGNPREFVWKGLLGSFTL